MPNNNCVIIVIIIIFIMFSSPLATHTQLEAQLSDAVKEDDDGDEKGFVTVLARETNSDSDSEEEEESHRVGGVTSPDTPPVFQRDQVNPMASFESSIISVDLGSSTVMTASVIDVEVRSECE